MKKKTFLALTVKLVFCVTCLQAQNSNDSAKIDSVHFFIMPNTAFYLKQSTIQNPLSGNFYSKHLPFFCNKELQLQKAVGIPIKFRLSTVEYCDKLEGKDR
ncbi:MAG: hypothetical protein ABI405_02485 [Parafilimonas sp.]